MAIERDRSTVSEIMLGRHHDEMTRTPRGRPAKERKKLFKENDTLLAGLYYLSCGLNHRKKDLIVFLFPGRL